MADVHHQLGVRSADVRRLARSVQRLSLIFGEDEPVVVVLGGMVAELTAPS